jgi:hemerythrin-like metal-binding protein
MAAISWDHHLAIGHEELDGQHRTLIATFNRLCAVVERGDGHREEQEGLLVFLHDFALAHFEVEHELMVRSRYPLEAEHRRFHTELASQLGTILDTFRQGTAPLTPDIMDYLDGWLQRHIREEDFRLAEFLNHAETHTREQP